MEFVKSIRRLGFWTLAAAWSLVLAICLLSVFAPEAQAIQTRQTDVATASSGNVLLGLDGTFSSDGKTAVLNRINAIRKEACKQGVPDPRDPGSKLKESDFVAMKWSSDLETIAQTRAAEGSVCEGHGRPNGDLCFHAHEDLAMTSFGENLAWNYSGMLGGIDQWYDEKSDWVKQNGGVTGHYESLIDPDHTHVGLGAFTPKAGGWTCVAGEFSNSAWCGGDISEAEVGVKGAYRQLIEVPKSSVEKLAISGAGTIKGVGSKKYTAVAVAWLDSVYGGTHDVELIPLGSLTWKTSNAAVVSIDASGKGASAACGSAKLSVASASLGMTGTKTVKVVPAATKITQAKGKKKAITVKWKKKASLAKGYQIRYSTKKSMKGAKTVTVKGAAKGAKTIKKLKSKTKYYVQVRSFAKVNGKMYTSSWSKKKAVKTK